MLRCHDQSACVICLVNLDVLARADGAIRVLSISKLSALGLNLSRSFGMHMDPRDVPMHAQSIISVLVASACREFVVAGDKPEQLQSKFSMTTGQAELLIVATNASSLPEYQLTAEFVVEIVSLLGFYFSFEEDVMNYRETDFQVVIDRWEKPEVVIALGHIVNHAFPC